LTRSRSGWLTEAGRELVIAESAPLDAGLVEAVLARLDDAEIDVINDALSRLAAAAAEHATDVRKEDR
jgi:hypothetical protein